jgi:hypothetical protein
MRSTLLLVTITAACTRGPSPSPAPQPSPPKPAAPPDAHPAPPPAPTPTAGTWTFALTTFAEGAVPGPTTVARVTSAGDVIFMTDSPPSLAIGKGASVDDLGKLVNGKDLWALKPMTAGGEGITRVYALENPDVGHRSLQLYESEPPPAKAVDDAIALLSKSAKTAPPYDGKFTVTITSQMEGVALGPLVTMTLDETGAFAYRSGSDPVKAGRAGVTDMAVVKMSLAAPDLFSVPASDLRSEGTIWTMKIQAGAQSIDRRFGYQLPLAAEPINRVLQALGRRAGIK